MTIGSPAARSCSISGWRADRPMITAPSTVARFIARASEPCRGEMKWRAYPSCSAASATPSENAPKKGLEKMTDSAWGVSTPMVRVARWDSIRATGWGR